MKKQNPLRILVIVILIIGLFLIMILYFNQLNKNKQISNFKECVKAGNPVMESYPRQCKTNGQTFVEEISWKNDKIILMKNSETDKYACFGCGKTKCIGPVSVMKPVKETLERHCDENFEVVTFNDKKHFCSNDSRNIYSMCITLYDPVCGWSNPDKIQCIKFPCASTYPNSCNACKNSEVLYWTKGKCPE